MRIVTILARRRVIVPGLDRETVNARVKTLRHSRVTTRTIHQRHRLVVIGMLGGNIGVTIDAGIRLVRRRRELGLVHEQRNTFAGEVGFSEGVVAVTIQTIAVLQAGVRRKIQAG